MDDIDKEIQATVNRQRTEDLVAAAVAKDPLPGPLADALAPSQNIQVGAYQVRPFRDSDFVALKALGHPLVCLSPAALAKMKAGDSDKVDSAAATLESFTPSGEDFWSLCWLLTRDSRKARDLLKEPGGVDKLKDSAFEEFGQMDSLTLAKLAVPVIEQFCRNCGVIQQHGAPKAAGGAEDQNPTNAAPS